MASRGDEQGLCIASLRNLAEVKASITRQAATAMGESAKKLRGLDSTLTPLQNPPLWDDLFRDPTCLIRSNPFDSDQPGPF